MLDDFGHEQTTIVRGGFAAHGAGEDLQGVRDVAAHHCEIGRVALRHLPHSAEEARFHGSCHVAHASSFIIVKVIFQRRHALLDSVPRLIQVLLEVHCVVTIIFCRTVEAALRLRRRLVQLFAQTLERDPGRQGILIRVASLQLTVCGQACMRMFHRKEVALLRFHFFAFEIVIVSFDCFLFNLEDILA